MKHYTGVDEDSHLLFLKQRIPHANGYNVPAFNENNREGYTVKHRWFVCPNCKHPDGHFGTFSFHDKMVEKPESRWYGKGYKTGDNIGYCGAGHLNPTSCEHEWVRNEKSDAEHFVEESFQY